MSTLSTIHPRQALFGSEPLPPTLPVCDHYSGVEARMRKSLMLQAVRDPLYNSTVTQSQRTRRTENQDAVSTGSSDN